MGAPIRLLQTTLALLAVAALAPTAARAQAYPDQPYPQQGYPQQQQEQQYPQQQYPQQGYPQQQYPQPDYQQQPGYQQPQNYPPQGYAPPANQPPPGYYAPAPAYPQQPTYSPPPPPPAYVPAPSTVPRYRQGFLWMPYIGANIPVGDAADAYGTGLRLGALFGLNINSFLSLNGEMTIDVLNFKTGSGVSASGAQVDFSFSPLFHFSAPMLEFVVGPKLGSFYMSETVSEAGTMDSTYSGEGISYGFNVGVFIPIGRIAIGGLLSYTGREFESCADCSLYGGTDNFFGLTGAILY